jgi:ATP diphosphatase
MTNSKTQNDLNYDLDDLIELMARLRDPLDGCPWDLAQNYKSIVPSTIEEAYEVADSIERGNYDDLREELGDLLFQTVFYSQLATEEERFSLKEVISDLVAKLVRRHPHVFPDGTLSSRTGSSKAGAASQAELDVNRSWAKIKEKERKEKGQSSVMDNIPLNLPALTRAQKIQERAANLGFDWENAEQVVPKIEEELTELREALNSGERTDIEEELGDLIFSCVNLSRKLKMDAEQVLRKAENKFVFRFKQIEQIIDSKGLYIPDMSLTELENYWQEAKKTDSD